MQVQQIPAVVDWLIHSGETIAICGAAYAVIKRVNRDESLKKDYPPHKHVTVGKEHVIIYPKEYQPAKTEQL